MVESNMEVPLADGEEKQDAIVDESVYKSGQYDSMVGSIAKQWTVRNPQDAGGHIEYTCTGVDNLGQWEGKRRFNDFFNLRECLVKRWPGVPIPILPPKKAVGNKDVVFIQERRYYLERFLRKLSRFDFIINAEEFQLFARPQGSIESQLKRLSRMSTSAVYERIKKASEVDDNLYDLVQKEQFANHLIEFSFFTKKTLPFLKQFRGDLSMFLTTRQAQISSYNKFAEALDQYEDTNLYAYNEGDFSKAVFTNPDNKALKEEICSHASNLKNPFVDYYHWVKGEIADLTAVQEAVEIRNGVAKQIKKLQEKKASTQKDLDAVNSGKKTIGTLFKSSSDAGGMANSIENTEREIELSNMLLDLLTIYIADKVIPAMKQEKLVLHRKVTSQFHVTEIANCHTHASSWSSVLKNELVKGSTAK